MHQKYRVELGAKSMLLLLLGLLFFPSHAQAKSLVGVGELKFGMSPTEVKALSGCSGPTECLYEILGKNRYFTLRYGNHSSPKTDLPSPPLTPDSQLTLIDIDMGLYTKEWLAELYQVLIDQYPASHSPSDQEETQFQRGERHEVTMGFADGFVLLKLVRRPFGNIILRLVFQDDATAQALRQHWESTSSP